MASSFMVRADYVRIDQEKQDQYGAVYKRVGIASEN